MEITVNGVAHTIVVPVIPAPEVRATPISIKAQYTRNDTLKGKIGYEVTINGVTRPAPVPQSAGTMIKSFLAANARARKVGVIEPWQLHVRYARGIWTNAAGEVPRSFTWEYLNEWTDPSPRFPEGQQKKLKIWGDEAPAVDSVLVRGVRRDLDGNKVEILSGHWIDSEFESGGRWSRSNGLELMDWTSGLAKALPSA